MPKPNRSDPYCSDTFPSLGRESYAFDLCFASIFALHFSASCLARPLRLHPVSPGLQPKGSCAAIMWFLIAYCTSSVWLLAFDFSMIRSL